MRLFLIGIVDMRPLQLEAVRKLAREHEVQYWLRSHDYVDVDEAEFPNTIFHNYFDALKALPAPGIDASRFEPWSREEIESFSDVESEYLTMADKWYPDWSVNKRKDLFYEFLRYWRGVMKKYSPDCIIFGTVPHEMFSFALYNMAKRESVLTLILDDRFFDTERYVAVEDYKVGHPKLQKARPASLQSLSPKMQEYYLRHRGARNPEPASMKRFFADRTPLRDALRFASVLWKFTKDGTLPKRALGKASRLFRESMIGEHRRLERVADFNEPYVYFPLHYQPELTTSPMGGVYADQILAIRTLAGALPPLWRIYVKEHPHQLAIHGGRETPARYKGFYEALCGIDRVQLVPISTNTFSLIDRSKATSAISGTALWEAALRGKPSLVFGYPWHINAPGAFHVGSVEECREALARIAKGFAQSEEEIIGYLKAADEISVDAWLYGTIERFPQKQNEGELMYEAIRNALSKP